MIELLLKMSTGEKKEFLGTKKEYARKVSAPGNGSVNAS